MAQAGQIIRAGQISGQRIETTIATVDSATFTTTETVIMDVTAALLAGRIYTIGVDTGIESTVADSRVIVRIRENALAGTVLQQRNIWPDFTGSIGTPVYFSAEFRAVSTGDKTFVLTAIRAAGTGTINMSAEGITPAYFYVDYSRG